MASQNWAVGIQTSPREGCLLDDTIRYVQVAGWPDPIVFGEPGTEVEGVRSVVWPHRFGDWANWLSALSCLHATRPDADYFVMFEDDIKVCRNVRPYLESFLYRLPNFGSLQLYTPPKHHRPLGQKPCLIDESHHGWEMWGAQGVVFTRASLRAFLSSSHVLGYRDTEIGCKNANKDSAIGVWGNEEGRALYYHVPSMVEHLPLPSLIGSAAHQAEEFVGDDFDASTWIGSGPTLVLEKIL